jgi:CRP-like cAMP-binding protein
MAKRPPRKAGGGSAPETEGAEPTCRNLLLAALPPADRDRLLQTTIDTVTLTLKEMLHTPGQPIQYVYFPGGGFCSIVTVLEDGSMVEVATVGREGLVGIHAMADGNPPVSAAMVQGGAPFCYRMTTEAFRDEMNRRGDFCDVVTRYSNALFYLIMQSTACNAVHTVEQRLARWLLMAQDHMEASEFSLTQEFAAMMLGATRPTVTVVAGTLQRAGLITYHRGLVRIVNREKLEDASCECYRTSTIILGTVTRS